jgi:plasmid maintenance system antidote protein VapI
MVDTTKQPPAAKEGERTLTPKQMAAKLGVDPKALRRVMREKWGTHYQRWEITPAMAKELTKAFAKKAK